MSKAEIEISINNDKLIEFMQEIIDLGNKYGLEPLILENRYVYFDFENLTEIKCI